MTSLWYLYIVRCADSSLYTGITTDLERRISEHNSSKLGSKYTRARRPVELVYHELFGNRSTVSAREAEIKKMTPAQKRTLIQSSI
ncbi:MAG: GIY-YIG nuclease family protein [Gammaproteobacteria bacterium]|nr:GIY-YIG nuclease family protein [Gammaproteobacteria bacterium]